MRGVHTLDEKKLKASMEWINNPPKVFSDWLFKRIEFGEKREKKLLLYLQNEFPLLSVDYIHQKIDEIHKEYAQRKIEAECFGSSHNINKALKNISRCANELALAFEKSVVGTPEVINLKIDVVVHDDFRKTMTNDEFMAFEKKLTMVSNHEDWFDWDTWVSNLKFLCAHAAYKTMWIEDMAGKGGRFTLADRVYGSPEDWLAEACLKFTEENHNYSKSIVLKIVQGIQESYRGEKGKPAAGRKAVRKLAQTKPESGTV